MNFRRCVAVLWCLLASQTPAQVVDKHLGVASCASGVCHGKLAPQKDKNVWLSEYRWWSEKDPHALAYKTLRNPESKKIADRLGIPNAQTAEQCLNCHTDNVAQSQRGPKFQLGDGVGCEACHGGAERWIESHSESTATHAGNLTNGMYATNQAAVLANVCVSCHVGNDDRFATHQLMAAGHPRLSFELDAFTTNRDPHYTIDDDYVRRKGGIEGFNLWLSGQLAAARRSAELLGTHWMKGAEPMYPELAFYDCDACHHPMGAAYWQRITRPGISAGSPRLQVDHLLVLQATAAVLDPGSAPALAAATNGLVRAGLHTDGAVIQATKPILTWISTHEHDWAANKFTTAQVSAVRRSLVNYAAEGRITDFAAAEQIFLGVESLSLYLGDRKKGAFDQMFQAVDQKNFDAAKFSAAARALANSL